MQKKLTITVDEDVYDELHKIIGTDQISNIIEDLVLPHVQDQKLEAAYEQMAQDEEREVEALEWSESTIGDVCNGQR